MSIEQAKSEMRAFMRRRRKLSFDEATAIMPRLLVNLMPLLKTVKNVAVYYAKMNEPDLKLVIEYCLGHSINVFAPIAARENKMMRFEAVFDNQVRDIFYSENYILGKEINAFSLDLVLVPLLAVDFSGIRLGQGGGYYDTTFAVSSSQVRPILCGVGYDWQLVDSLPHYDWDIRLDYFVDSSKLHHFTLGMD
jgi:5-formyltetrahydrofolate cyclo-ligase